MVMLVETGNHEMKQNVLEKHYKKFCILIETVIFFKNIVYFFSPEKKYQSDFVTKSRPVILVLDFTPVKS